jgi:hypothetical protein
MDPLGCQTLELTPRDYRGGEAQASGHGKNDSPFTRCERGRDTPKAAPAPALEIATACFAEFLFHALR